MSENASPSPSVDGSSLAAALGAFIGKYVVLSESQLIGCVLWVLHAWAFGPSVSTPYLFILSAQRQSGKTRLLEVLEVLVRRPLRISGVSEAALFRVIEAEQPTILIDEADAIFGGGSERTEPIRGALNAGNRQGGAVARCVPPHWEVRSFNVYCPKVLAGIDKGTFPDTLLDRSIVVRLKRRTRDEEVAKFRLAAAQAETEPLRALCEEWAEQTLDALTSVDPVVPDELGDRAADAWEPLFAIADSIGDVWPTAARNAAVQLFTSQEKLEDSLVVLLLGAIREVFESQNLDRLPSQKLCELLNGLPDTPWASWSGKGGSPGIRPGTLASLLRPFDIVPGTIRVGASKARGDTIKGYYRSEFEDAWMRYLGEVGDDM